MKRIIYLAGFISTEFTESLEWRKRVTPHLVDAGFEVRTPLQGKKNLKKETTDGGITSTVATSRDIILRDRRDCKEAHVILVHLETFGAPRPLLGTIAELAWAWDENTPVVAIAAEDNYVARKHPFMAEFVSHFFPNEEEALNFLSLYHAPYKAYDETS